MDFRATLSVVGGRLDAPACRWAVIGGVAMGIYGVPRATVDVDLLVEITCAARLDELLAGLGYEVAYRWEESSHFASSTADLCPLDVLHAHRAHSLGMLERAGRVPLGEGGLAVPVVELEDLIGLKVQAMVNDADRRRGELVDIRALLEAAAAQRVRLDGARINEYFALFHEEAELDGLMQGLNDAFA
jgi:predicted nucleotidyltransferase